MKKLFLLVLAIVFGMATSASALTLAWDSYTDPDATGLRIEASTDGGANWSTLVDNIPTTYTAANIPDGTEYTRVFYRMRAFNATDTSDPSNSVSFYWLPDGGGYEGLAPVNGIKLLDCDEILAGPSDHPDFGTCQNAYGN